MQLFSLCNCGVTNENNRSYLKKNQYVEENNRANRIIGKIKRILGSGLEPVQGHGTDLSW